MKGKADPECEVHLEVGHPQSPHGNVGITGGVTVSLVLILRLQKDRFLFV